MLLRVSLLAFGLALPVTAFATEHEVSEYGAILDACYAAAGADGSHADCIGKMAEACMEREEGGYSTLGMTSCTNAEAQVWDKYLNLEYRETMAHLKAMDTEEAVYFQEFAKRVESLRGAQRAWIAFRDAECGLEYAMWGSGSMRNIAWASCALDMTAKRPIELRELGSEMR